MTAADFFPPEGVAGLPVRAGSVPLTSCRAIGAARRSMTAMAEQTRRRIGTSTGRMCLSSGVRAW